MITIDLQKVLNTNGMLTSGIVCSSKLIPQLEVYGYVNSCGDEDMISNGYSSLLLNGIVNKSPIHEVVCSHYLYQVITYWDGKTINSKGIASPVSATISLAKRDMEFNLEDIYVPSLVKSQTYRNIRSRHGVGVIVTEQMIKRASFPNSIVCKNGKAIISVKKGDILCKNIDGNIDGIGDNIMALCRYLHPETGSMCYTQFNLNEIYTIYTEQYDDDLD